MPVLRLVGVDLLPLTVKVTRQPLCQRPLFLQSLRVLTRPFGNNRGRLSTVFLVFWVDHPLCVIQHSPLSYSAA